MSAEEPSTSTAAAQPPPPPPPAASAPAETPPVSEPDPEKVALANRDFRAAALAILDVLEADKVRAEPFMKPLEEIADASYMKLYSKTIKKPMDFRTIREHLTAADDDEELGYVSPAQFLYHLGLVFQNALKWNKSLASDPNSVYNYAKALKDTFLAEAMRYGWGEGSEMMQEAERLKRSGNLNRRRSSVAPAALASGSGAAASASTSKDPESQLDRALSALRSGKLLPDGFTEAPTCIRVLRSLVTRRANPTAKAFEKLAPGLDDNYYAFITEPMYIAKIALKLSEAKYHSQADFVADVHRMFANYLMWLYCSTAFAEERAAAVSLLDLFNSEMGIEPSIRPESTLRNCRRMLDDILSEPDPTFFFIKPANLYGVDLHDYESIVKTPMDLGAVQDRLYTGKYDSPEAMMQDIRLTFRNGISYNSKGDFADPEVKKHAENLLAKAERLYEQYFGDGAAPAASGGESLGGAGPAAVAAAGAGTKKLKRSLSLKAAQDSAVGSPATGKPKRGTAVARAALDVKTTCAPIISKLLKNKTTREWFGAPVDWEALNLLDYPKIIKEPMDLGTIRTRLAEGYYGDDLDKFERDVRLVFANCRQYNPKESPILTSCAQAESVFDAEFEPVSRAYRAAKESLSAPPSPPSPPAALPGSDPPAEQEAASPAPSAEDEGRPESPLFPEGDDDDENDDAKSSSSETVARASPTPKANTVASKAPPRVGGQKAPPPPPASHSSPLATLQAPPLQRESLPPDPKVANTPTTIAAIKLLDRILRHEWAAPYFGVPVLEIFTDMAFYQAYTSVIAQPMDLRTVRDRLLAGRYEGNVDGLKHDLGLIYSNAITFNAAPEEEQLRDIAARVRDLTMDLLHEFPELADPEERAKRRKAREDRIASEPMTRPVKKVLRALTAKSRKENVLFLLPFDWRAAGPRFQDYPQIVRRPMDLSTVGKNLEARKYKAYGEFAADVRLIFENCLLYNPDVEHNRSVRADAMTMRDVFEEQWADATVDLVDRIEIAALQKKWEEASAVSVAALPVGGGDAAGAGESQSTGSSDVSASAAAGSGDSGATSDTPARTSTIATAGADLDEEMFPERASDGEEEEEEEDDDDDDDNDDVVRVGRKAARRAKKHDDEAYDVSQDIDRGEEEDSEEAESEEEEEDDDDDEDYGSSRRAGRGKGKKRKRRSHGKSHPSAKQVRFREGAAAVPGVQTMMPEMLPPEQMKRLQRQSSEQLFEHQQQRLLQAMEEAKHLSKERANRFKQEIAKRRDMERRRREREQAARKSGDAFVRRSYGDEHIPVHLEDPDRVHVAFAVGKDLRRSSWKSIVSVNRSSKKKRPVQDVVGDVDASGGPWFRASCPVISLARDGQRMDSNDARLARKSVRFSDDAAPPGAAADCKLHLSCELPEPPMVEVQLDASEGGGVGGGHKVSKKAMAGAGASLSGGKGGGMGFKGRGKGMGKKGGGKGAGLSLNDMLMMQTASTRPTSRVFCKSRPIALGPVAMELHTVSMARSTREEDMSIESSGGMKRGDTVHLRDDAGGEGVFVIPMGAPGSAGLAVDLCVWSDPPLSRQERVDVNRARCTLASLNPGLLFARDLLQDPVWGGTAAVLVEELDSADAGGKPPEEATGPRWTWHEAQGVFVSRFSVSQRAMLPSLTFRVLGLPGRVRVQVKPREAEAAATAVTVVGPMEAAGGALRRAVLKRRSSTLDSREDPPVDEYDFDFGIEVDGEGDDDGDGEERDDDEEEGDDEDEEEDGEEEDD